MPEPADTSLAALIDAAFRKAAVEAVRLARRTGTPLIVWRDGEVRAVSPDEYPEEETPTPPTPAVPQPE